VGGGRWRASSTTSSGGSWSDGQEERRDLIILPDRVVRNWWRHAGHALALEDLDQVLDDLPEHLVIGTGAHGPAAQGGWGDGESLPTGRAVRRYGELEPARTAAALHLTC
jgi:hypothetical protein